MGRPRFVLPALALPALVILAACDSGTSTPPEPPTFEERLELALDGGFAATDGKGYAVTLWIPGRPMWTGVAGVSHGTVPVTPGMPFAAGSITKTFTAITVLRLAEEGLLSVDDSVHSWLPAYPHVDPDITLRQLLSHTSGLSDFVDTPGWLAELLQEPDRVWGMEEYLVGHIEPPYFEKGTSWSYSSTGYVLLRMIIEQVTGQTVAQAYHAYVIDPLGLDDTYVCPEEPHPANRAHGWLDITGDGVYDDFAVLPITAFCSVAGGQVYSTSADLAALGRALMRDRTILQDASYEEMTDFHFPVGHDEPLVHGYGLGLMWFGAESVPGLQRVWGHGGDAPGYAAGMFYLVDHDVVVGVTDNTEHGVAMGVLFDLMDVVLEEIG